MSLDLDDRHRAMLQEMGVHVWWPQADAPVVEAAPAPASVPLAQPTAPPAVIPAEASIAIEHRVVDALSVRGGVSRPAQNTGSVVFDADAVVGEMAHADWAGLSEAISACQACKLCVGRRAPVFSAMAATAQADWLVVGDPPEDGDERAGFPFSDQVGLLLDNMLKAVGVTRQDALAPVAASQAAYLTHVVKCRPALPRAPQPQDLAACESYLKREIALTQPKVILAMGRVAAQTLLRESDAQVGTTPLGKLRGQIYQYQGIPVVVSYPPTYLLRTQQDKARAWADLCLALSVARPDQV
ncbi:uracil-DNA glycosylase [Rhodoferax sp. PAMC 29310]|uniref:uracil-DNA glycosylase n=1 Tax=Rhodoferax sp. PAMC 29310 TaxID=2822760 RepID=UPI001B31E304|nr:uracil-DNA glycosylase [Rhodoferax sp. PAMC 29310]